MKLKELLEKSNYDCKISKNDDAFLNGVSIKITKIIGEKVEYVTETGEKGETTIHELISQGHDC